VLPALQVASIAQLEVAELVAVAVQVVQVLD
jgi:hypothetical protein